MAKKDYYEILGIDDDATVEEIKKAYRKKANEHHPDHNKGSKRSEEKFKKVAEAYEILSDHDKRRQYDGKDKTGAGGGAGGGGTPPDKPIHGEFYTIGTDGKLYIHEAQLLDFIEKCGWRWVRIGGGKRLVRIINNVIEESDPGEIVRYIRQWIKGLPYKLGYGITSNKLCDAVVSHSRYLFEKIRFEYIKENSPTYLRDTRNSGYLCYNNGVVEVTATAINLIPYTKIQSVVWKHEIINRDFIATTLRPLESEIEQFLYNISGQDKARYRSLITHIGYILHSYKDPSNAIAIIFIDEVVGESGDCNGGTGKSIVTRIFEQILSTVVLPGKTFTAKRTFALQRLRPGTRVLVLQDVDTNENFETYYNLITDGITIEQKYKGEIYIPFEYSPKVVITANNVLKAPTGNSTDRRKSEFEVSDWYGPGRTPKDQFGHNLFNDWSPEEWQRFDNAAIKMLQFYLKFGLIRPPQINIATRRVMREIGEELFEFLEDKLLEGVTHFHKKNIHDEFIKAFPDLRMFYRSPNKTTKKMKKFFLYKGIPFYEHPAATKKYIIIEPKKDNSVGDGTSKGGEPTPPVTPAPDEGTAHLTIKDVAHKYTLIKTAEDRKTFIAELKKQKELAFDCETTGLDFATLEIRGLAISFKTHEAYYIPMPKDFEKARNLLAEFEPVFSNAAIKKVAHNFKFDNQVLKKYGIEINGAVFDTMLAHYLCKPDAKQHGLKLITEQMLNYKEITFEEVTTKNNKRINIDDVPLAVLADYAGEDADTTLQLKHPLEKEIKDKGLYNLLMNIEVPLARVLGDMEAEGVRVDAQVLRELNVQAKLQMLDIAKEVYMHAGEDFNIDSPKQLGNILFVKLGLEPGDKTESGQYSTAADVLDTLKDAHPIVPLIIKYNKISSLSDTFMEKLPNCVNPFTNRVHTHFNQAITSTGRLSSSEPNVQNIPKQAHGFGQEIRKAFVPRDENHVLVAADFSQVELRIAAHYSEEKALIEAYRRGDDVHTTIAAAIYGITKDKVTTEQRKTCKAVGFGILYGMGEKTLAAKLTKELHRPVAESEAKEIIDSYFTTYPGIKAFKDKALFNVVTNGYSQTLMGRKRFLPDINSYDPYKRHRAERHAVNSIIQGSCADIMKLAMLNIYRELNVRGLKARLVLQVHDELVIDTPKNELEIVMALVKDKMENAVTLKVPLVVDIKYGNNWYEAH